MQHRRIASEYTGARSARGFSIIELMVAVAISLLLLTGVGAIFVSSKTSYETNERFSRIEENGRFALDAIMTDLRSSGFVGCARQPTYLSTSLNSAATLQWNFLAGPVTGFQSTGTSTWSPTMDASIASPLSGSDVLVARVPMRERVAYPLTANLGAATNSLQIAAGSANGVQTGDIALVYSCEAISVFQVSTYTQGTGVIAHAANAAGQTPGNANNTVNYSYRQAVTNVVPIETVAYYIAPATRVSDATDPAPAGTTSLWRRRGLNAAEELVEGIEQMQVQYGVDTNGDVIVDSYLTADQVQAANQWNDVISVSVALLVRSIETYGTDTDQRAYTLLDVNVAAPADRRLREVFTATASIRNRVRVN
ncbi:MAG TPA: PilW family protein [Steroidobacteraceae bacterium]|jgi:type IV pilus assembly protein PilW